MSCDKNLGVKLYAKELKMIWSNGELLNMVSRGELKTILLRFLMFYRHFKEIFGYFADSGYAM